MQKNEMMSLFCAGFLILGSGGVNAAEPEPGTREYFDQKILGEYAFDGGELVKIHVPSGVMGVTRPSPSSLSRVQWVEGHLLQIMSSNLVVLGKAITNASGIVTFQRSRIVSLIGTRTPEQGASIRLLAVSDGLYTYNDASGSGTLTGYREVAEPTFEDYLKIYERDAKAEVVPPIISVERIVNTPRGILPTPPVSGVQATPTSTNRSALLTSYRDRLNERKKALENQKLETDRVQKEALSKMVSASISEALRKQQEEATAQTQQVKPNPASPQTMKPLPPGVVPVRPLSSLPPSPGGAPRPKALPVRAPLSPPSS